SVWCSSMGRSYGRSGRPLRKRRRVNPVAGSAGRRPKIRLPGPPPAFLGCPRSGAGERPGPAVTTLPPPASRHRPPPAAPAHQRAQEAPMDETIRILPWHDPVIDTLGHDPRARYPERFWLPTLGPSALFLIRHLADRFDEEPAGFELGLVEVS